MIEKKDKIDIVGYRLKDGNGFAIADQTSEPLTFTIGDSLRLEVDFSSSFTAGQTIDTLYANFGLFIKKGCVAPIAKPEFGYAYTVNSGTTNGVEYEMCFTGDVTEQNQKAYVEFNSPTLDSFTVSLDFVATDDLDRFVNGNALPNIERLLKGLINSTMLSNDGASVYNTLKALGVIVYAETQIETGYNSFAIDSQGRFLQESNFTAETFEFERAGSPVVDVSSITDTDIKAKATYTGGTISQAKMWAIRTNAIFNARPFFEDGQTLVSMGAVSSPAANEYEATYTLPSADVSLGDVWYFVTVFYDETGNYTGAFVSGAIQTISTQDEPLLESADFDSGLSNYNYALGDYIDSPPLLRIDARMEVLKAGYNSKAYSGDFDSNFQNLSIELVVGGSVVANDTIDYIDTPTDIRYIYSFRVSEDWIGQQLTIRHKFAFLMDGQADTYINEQLLDVLDYDENRGLDAAILTLGITDALDNPITDVCDNPNQDIKTIATSDIEDYNHILTMDTDGGLVESEKYISPSGMEQLDPDSVTANDVDYLGLDASATIDLSTGVSPIGDLVVHALPLSSYCAILTEEGYPVLTEEGGVAILEDC